MKNKMVREAKRLYDFGFAVHWLHPQSKRPIENGWTTGPRKPWADLIKSYRDGNNIGVRTGTPSQIGENFLTCIDVDIKTPVGKAPALAKLKELIGDDTYFPEVRSGAGNGSRHIYCVTAEPFKMITIGKTDDWEICIYSDGRQMVLPPSIHPSGAEYKWVKPVEWIVDLPKWNFSQWQSVKSAKSEKTKKKSSTKKASSGGSFNFEPDLTLDLRWLPDLKESVRAAIIDGKGVEDRSAYLIKATHALLSAGLEVNGVMTVLTDRTLYLGKCAYEHAKTDDRKRAAEWLWKYTVEAIVESRDPKAVFSAVTGDEPQSLPADEAEIQTEDFLAEIPWESGLKKTYRKDGEPGSIIDSLNNLDIILSHAVPQPIFVKDEFANRESYGADAPWGKKKGEELSDIDTVLIKSWLAKSKFQLEPINQTIEQSMALLAHLNSTHPVREWLTSLRWDGKPRIDRWIKNYLEGEAPEPYLSDISRKFLVAMVSRVFRPGSQWDYTLILEGEQGTRKSTTARILAGDKWFCDHLPDLKDKDAMLNLQGSWLVELGELKNVKHADAATVKSFLTRRTDRVRAPYGKRWIDAPRQSVFIGTVNENEYFKDPTGNRRFWPVLVGRCNTEKLIEDRDQLFAEAKFVYDSGAEKLFLEDESLKQAMEAQDDRRVDDDITEMEGALEEFIRREMDKPTHERFRFSRFKMRDLFVGNEVPWGRWTDKPFATQNGAQVLRNKRFEKYKIEGQRIWRFRGKIRGTSGAYLKGSEEDFF